MWTPCFSAVSFTLLSNYKPPHPDLSAKEVTWARKSAPFNNVATAQGVYDPENMKVHSHRTFNSYKFWKKKGKDKVSTSNK